MSVEGTPIDVPLTVPDTICVDQAVVQPKITRLYDVSLPTKRRAIFAQQNQPITVQISMLNAAGNPVDLETCTDYDVTVKIREVITTKRTATFTLTGSIADVSTGEISVDVPVTITNNPGVYYMESALMADAMVFSNTSYLWVNRGLFGTPKYPNAGPPSLDEVRLFIRDNAPEENRLLDDFEFDLAEICHSAESAVRYWNESQPPINVNFTTQNYQARHMWLKYIAGHMLQVAAHRFRRNHLPYQAGGISVDDQNKFQMYDQTGMMLTQEYKEWVKQKKVQINCQAAMTSSYSAYSGWLYYTLNTGV